MSISIAINNINDLTDFERDILRRIAADPCMTVADALKQTVRRMAGCGHTCEESGRLACDDCGDKLAEHFVKSEVMRAAPIEPAPSGTLCGDEFLSAMENVPDVMTVLAESMSKSEGQHISLADLRNLSTNNKITVKVLVEALSLAVGRANPAPIPVEPEEVYSPHTAVSDAAWLDNNLNPPADAPSAPPAPASAERDSAGLPWDKRIHAPTRTKVADGTWRYMRGVDKALIEQVEAELRAVQAIPVPVAPAMSQAAQELETLKYLTFPAANPAVVADGTNAVITVPASGDGNEIVRQVATECVAVAPVVPLPPVPQAPTALPMTFAQLMQHITPLLVSGKLTQPKLQGVAEKLGLPHLAHLGGRPDLIDTVKAAIDEAVGGAQ